MQPTRASRALLLCALVAWPLVAACGGGGGLTTPVSSAAASRGPLAKLLISPGYESVDVMGLFTQPERWADARQYVRTFSVTDLDLQAPRNRFSPSDLSLIASSLSKWGIDLAFEVGAVKEWGCRSETTIATTSVSIDRLVAAGGRVSSLAMDEPLWAGRRPIPEGCGYDLERTAVETIAYMDEMRKRNPGIKVGLIEPWPAIDRPTLITWIARLRAGNPDRLSFFRLDINAAAVRPGPVSASDPNWGEAAAIANYCRTAGIPFSVIIWSAHFSFPIPLNSDERFYHDSLSFGRFVRERLSTLTSGGDDLPIMSWVPFPRPNLPDNAGYSFTHLVRDSGREFIGR